MVQSRRVNLERPGFSRRKGFSYLDADRHERVRRLARRLPESRRAVVRGLCAKGLSRPGPRGRACLVRRPARDHAGHTIRRAITRTGSDNLNLRSASASNARWRDYSLTGVWYPSVVDLVLCVIEHIIDL
jgi:hypothetical protein